MDVLAPVLRTRAAVTPSCDFQRASGELFLPTLAASLWSRPQRAPRSSPMRANRQDLGGNALAASMTFALAVALFTLGGWWLDQRLGTRAVFLVLGFLVGAAGGMLHLLGRLGVPLPFARRSPPPRPPTGSDSPREPAPRAPDPTEPDP